MHRFLFALEWKFRCAIECIEGNETYFLIKVIILHLFSKVVSGICYILAKRYISIQAVNNDDCISKFKQRPGIRKHVYHKQREWKALFVRFCRYYKLGMCNNQTNLFAWQSAVRPIVDRPTLSRHVTFMSIVFHTTFKNNWFAMNITWPKSGHILRNQTCCAKFGRSYCLWLKMLVFNSTVHQTNCLKQF